MALGRQASGGCCVGGLCSCSTLRVRLFRPTCSSRDWDNLKELMIWGYVSILPFLWSDIISLLERAATCLLLFGSGFVMLLGGLSAGHSWFGLIERLRPHYGTALRPLPAEARFAICTQLITTQFEGRKVVGVTRATCGRVRSTAKANHQLTALMNGAASGATPRACSALGPPGR